MRKSISKKTRFEVFKRDSFTCQYCGRKAPEIVLECDHIQPVAEGGKNDILNLITSCAPCNSGKGARVLSDQTTLAKQVDQLAELQSRREQIEMLLEWRQGVANIETDMVDQVAIRWTEASEGLYALSATGKDKLRKWIKSSGLDFVLQAIPETISSYAKREADQTYNMDSLGTAFMKLGAVAKVLKLSAEKPYLRQLYYIRGILRQRLSYVDDHLAMKLMERAVELGADTDSLQRLSKSVRNWTNWKEEIEQYIGDHEGQDHGETPE